MHKSDIIILGTFSNLKNISVKQINILRGGEGDRYWSIAMRMTEELTFYF
jgi:hypothetical protein